MAKHPLNFTNQSYRLFNKQTELKHSSAKDFTTITNSLKYFVSLFEKCYERNVLAHLNLK